MSHMPIVMNCSGHIELLAVSDMCHSFQQMRFEIIDVTPLSFTTQLRHHFLLEDSWDLLSWGFPPLLRHDACLSLCLLHFITYAHISFLWWNRSLLKSVLFVPLSLKHSSGHET